MFVGLGSLHGWSLWSIARVEHRFADLTSGPANLIILRGFFHVEDKSERYFVEGVRSTGVFTRFLPVFEPTDCGRTARLDDAGVALRVLREGLPSSGGRLIGRVYASIHSAPRNAVPGVSVLATGPAGSVVSVTDAQGIYDFIGLPPGHYTVEPLTKSNGRNLGVGLPLKPGDVEDLQPLSRVKLVVLVLVSQCASARRWTQNWTLLWRVRPRFLGADTMPAAIYSGKGKCA